MELTFLGTSAGVPTRQRHNSGLALRRDGAWDLFDCGEATQHQVMRTGLSLAKLRRVFVSHLHGDHVFGIFGVISSRALQGATAELTIFGPAGIEHMVRTVIGTCGVHVTFPLDFHEVGEIPDDGARVVDDDTETIDVLPLRHRVPSHAWWIREADRPGAFDVDAARSAGVVEGPDFGRLQRGEQVSLADGSTVRPDDVIGAPRPGRVLVVAGDNSDPTHLLARTGGVPLLIHEATFTEAAVAHLGDDRGHSTAARIAGAAEDAGVGNLVLTHFSPRYSDGNDARFSIDNIRSEAAGRFSGGLHLAEDLSHFTVAVDGHLDPVAVP